MKCPLLKAELRIDDNTVTGGFPDCLQEECAWWLAEWNRCAILSIAAGVNNMVDQLDRLNDGIRLVK